MISQTAASHCPVGPPYIEAPQILDVAICYRSSNMLSFDDNTTNSWDISFLVKLDVHHHPQHFSFLGAVFSGGVLPCVCKGVETSQSTCQVLVHQGNCLLLLLAGKYLSCSVACSSASSFEGGALCKPKLCKKLGRAPRHKKEPPTEQRSKSKSFDLAQPIQWIGA